MKFAVALMALLSLAACNQSKSKASSRQYPVTGTIVSINAQDHTALIDAAAIPDYMDAMKMDYPIASDSDLAALKVGEKITGTLMLSDDGSYRLANIHDAKNSVVGK